MANAHILKFIALTVAAAIAFPSAVHAAAPATRSPQQEVTLPEFTQTTLKSGWIEYASEAEGFSVALPAEWFHLKDNSPEMISQAMQAANPDMETSLAQQIEQQYAAGMKFMAVDTASYLRNGFGMSINVVKNDLPAAIRGTSMKSLVNILAVQLKEMFKMKTTPATSVIKLNGHEAGKVVSQITYTIGDEPYDATVTQYILIDKPQKNMYVMTLGGLRKTAAKDKALLDRVARTFTLLEK